MKSQFYVLSFVFITLIIASCEKSNTPAIVFPEITQEGKNTFGCYVDHDQFIASTTLFGLVHPISVSYFYDSTQMYKAGSLFIQGIDARSTLPFAGSVVVQKMNIFAPGTYPLTYIPNCSQQYTCDASWYRNTTLSTNYFSESGELIITKLDTVNRIVSGTFHFTAKDLNGVKKEITNGRFDAKYNQ